MQQQPNNNTKGASPPNPMWETILETLISVENPWKTLSCFDFFWWWRVFSTVCAVEATILPALRFHTRYSSPVRARLACEKGRDPAKTCKNEESLGFLLRLLSGRRSMSGVYEFKPLQKKTRVSKVELNLVYRRMLLFASRWTESSAKMCGISRFTSFHGHGLPLANQEPFKEMSDIDLQ